MPGLIHVVAGVLRDAAGRVLIARRPAGVHQGGLWEFPGGKLEAGEAPKMGLARELREELGIEPRASRPLIQVEHDYGDRRVLLDVHLVLRYRGQPRGREGQPLTWCSIEALDPAHFPPADRPVISALGLPPLCLITPEASPSTAVTVNLMDVSSAVAGTMSVSEDTSPPAGFLACLERATEAGGMLVQLRAHGLSDGEFEALARAAAPICRARALPLLLNRALEVASPLLSQHLARGVHLSAARLNQLTRRPNTSGLLGASCHTAEDLARASALQLDYAVLSPVCPTRSHPDARPLGWDGFARLVRSACVPVYALGGLTAQDLDRAWAHGAQGIAAMRGLWPCS